MNPQAVHPSEPGRQDRVSRFLQTWAGRNGAFQTAGDRTEAGLTPDDPNAVPMSADDRSWSDLSLPGLIRLCRIRSGSIPRGQKFLD